jgi:hypothetical protein
MLSLKTEAELNALHENNVRENLHLEYKASGAVDKKDDKRKLEMARDISAFANSDSGQIVYGMTETDNDPAGLDEGLDPKAFPEIWFEQIVQQHVTPPIVGLKPHHVPLQSGRVAVVIDVPAAKGDPHQVDGRYYRRHNFNRLIMEHYEIRDAFRRQITPDLFVTLSFLDGDRHNLGFPERHDTSHPFNLIADINNRSNQPASHAVVDIGIAAELVLISRGSYERLDQADNDRRIPMHWLRWTVASPPALPIFKEHRRLLTDNVIMLAINHRDMGNHKIFDLTVKISAPGFSSTEHWAILARGPRLTLYPPGSPYAAQL